LSMVQMLHSTCLDGLTRYEMLAMVVWSAWSLSASHVNATV
jgi:hypothetical protein